MPNGVNLDNYQNSLLLHDENDHGHLRYASDRYLKTTMVFYAMQCVNITAVYYMTNKILGIGLFDRFNVGLFGNPYQKMSPTHGDCTIV